MNDNNLDLDTPLAIVRKRTPGEWYGPCGGQIMAGDQHVGQWLGRPDDESAIVAAVNNFEAVAERCKRAEEWNDYDATISELTRQRDELLAALRFVEDYSKRIDQPSLTRQVRIVLESVKERSDCGTPQGGTDGEA